jgi:hypothetical protein
VSTDIRLDSGLNNTRCPRCGGTFHCGADDPGPCPCTTVTLDAAMLASLRERFHGCLCLTCLNELAREGGGAR